MNYRRIIIKITEIIGKTRCSMYNSYFNACWDDDVDDVDDENDNIVEDTLNSYEDIILNQAIQESLKEVKNHKYTKKSIMYETIIIFIFLIVNKFTCIK